MKYNEFGELVDDTPTTRQRSQPTVAPQAPVAPQQLPLGPNAMRPNAASTNQIPLGPNYTRPAQPVKPTDPGVLAAATAYAQRGVPLPVDPSTGQVVTPDHGDRYHVLLKQPGVTMWQGPSVAETPFYNRASTGVPSSPTQQAMASGAMQEFNKTYSAEMPRMGTPKNLEEYDKNFRSIIDRIPNAGMITDEVKRKYYEAHMPENIRQEYGQMRDTEKINRAFQNAGVKPEDRDNWTPIVDPNTGRVQLQHSEVWTEKQIAAREKASEDRTIAAAKATQERQLAHEKFMAQQEATAETNRETAAALKEQQAETRAQAKQKFDDTKEYHKNRRNAEKDLEKIKKKYADNPVSAPSPDDPRYDEKSTNFKEFRQQRNDEIAEYTDKITQIDKEYETLYPKEKPPTEPAQPAAAPPGTPPPAAPAAPPEVIAYAKAHPEDPASAQILKANGVQ